MRKSRALLIATSALVVGAATIAAPLSAGAAPAAAASTTPRRSATSTTSCSTPAPRVPAAPAPPSPRAGGTIESTNDQVGFAVVRGVGRRRAAISRSTAVSGVARNRVIGVRPQGRRSQEPRRVERLTTERAAAKAAGQGQGQAGRQARHGRGRAVAPEPLADSQWDMRQIGATPTGSYAVQPGKPGRPGRRHRHRHRRHPPGHRAELRRRRLAQLRHRPAGHRRAVRGAQLHRQPLAPAIAGGVDHRSNFALADCGRYPRPGAPCGPRRGRRGARE